MFHDFNVAVYLLFKMFAQKMKMLGQQQRIMSAIALVFSLLLNAVLAEISLGYFPDDSMQDVAGEVVVISDKIVEIRNFIYSGNAPDAFFWADDEANATRNGFILLHASKNCSNDVLEYANGTETITLEFPEETSMTDVLGGSISVWCRMMSVNLGQVAIPASLNLSSIASEENVPLQCSDVEEGTLLERLADAASRLWNVAVYFITSRGEE